MYESEKQTIAQFGDSRSNRKTHHKTKKKDKRQRQIKDWLNMRDVEVAATSARGA